MPRPPSTKEGHPLSNQPKGAPLFYGGRRLPRVVTSDPWAFLRFKSQSELPKEQRSRAVAYIDQAFDFFEAASNPRTSSRPLLYYYSFLNLSKVLVLHKKQITLPLLVRHGIYDPRANVKERLRFEGQRVTLSSPDRTHSELFPEFLLALSGASALCGRAFRVIDLMGQIAGIHRTWTALQEGKPRFCPIEPLEFWSDGKGVWAVLKADDKDVDVKQPLRRMRRSMRFRKLFTQVAALSRPGNEPNPKQHHLWFRTAKIGGSRRGIDRAIDRLSKRLSVLGIHGILTQTGYRYYLPDLPPRLLLPQLCSIYAVMFYLGSVTRYKPHYFDAIVARGYEWPVAEFLETQPTQFLYLVSSHIAGVEVVKPYATIRHG